MYRVAARLGCLATLIEPGHLHVHGVEAPAKASPQLYSKVGVAPLLTSDTRSAA